MIATSFGSRSHTTTSVEVFLQKIESRDGHISCEALGRLSSGGRILSPAEFLPRFDGADIAEFDREVLAKAIPLAGRDSGVHVHVNADSHTLKSGGYAVLARELLCAHRVDPSYLTVEVVEPVPFWRDERVVSELRKVRQAGMGVAIDDFPCWENPDELLDWVRANPGIAGTLKLDRTVVRVACDCPSDDTVPRYIAGAHALGMDVVAEGVESDGDVLTMLELGADALQGYGIAMPVPAIEFGKANSGYAHERTRHVALWRSAGKQLPTL